MANNGTVTLSFEYNGDGLRTSKTVNGVKHTYRLNGSQIVSEAWGNNLLIYLYDAEGAPVGMMYRNSTYPSDTFDTFWFEKNLQGDIVAVYDEDGTKLISYTYDAWGNFATTYHNDCTASNHANLNPFRYRGYYYDTETGLYYLQSRYYNPKIGRFISADSYASTGQGILGNNMYAYCLNNPVRYSDPTGESATIAGAIIGGLFGAINGLINGDSWTDVLACAAVGAATGALAGFAADVSIASFGIGGAILASAAAGGFFSGVNSVASYSILNDGDMSGLDPGKLIFDIAIGALAGGTCTAMSSLGAFQSLGIKAGIRFAKATVAAEEFMFMSQAYIGSALWFDIGATAVTTFGAWTAGVVYDYYHAILEVI